MEGNGNEYGSIVDESMQIRKRDKVKKYIIPGITLAVIVWGLVVLAHIIKRPNQDSGNTDSKFQFPNSDVTENGSLKVSFDNVRNGTFRPKFDSIQWLDNFNAKSHDNGLFLIFKDNEYAIESVVDKSFHKTLLNGKTFEHNGQNYSIDSLVASPQLNLLLIRTETVKKWRHSTTGTYFVFDDAKSEFNLLGTNISFAEWAPNSKDIAYVKENNVFTYSCESWETVTQVTDDGSSQIFNGLPDWVYEEEVFETDRSLWWSPGSDYIVFTKIDESAVYEYTIPYYVQNEDDSYPEMRSIKYPKSGTPNPKAKLMVHNLKTGKTFTLDINNQDSNNSVLTEVVWVGFHQFLFKYTNRSSDTLNVYLGNAKTQDTTTLRSESSENGWWEIGHNTFYVTKNASNGRPNNGYIDLIPINGYNHLVYYSLGESVQKTILTEGDWEVVDGVVKFDEESNDIYFIATKKSSTERHVYMVNLSDPRKIHDVTDTASEGVYEISFSAGAKFGLLTYKGPEVPYQKVIEFKSGENDENTVGNVIGKTLSFVEKNKDLKSYLTNYDVPKKEFATLNLGKDENDEDILVNSYEILPNDFDSLKKNYYPVFFFAYGGPNSQQVIKTFSVGFNEVIASQLGAIVVVVDGRGTGFKGKNFRSVVRGNLGDLEAQDQISTAKLYGSKSYVDAEKISLFGWSYGGYLTLKTLEADSGNHFKYGMSVAPVTDWMLYDSVYTERYMNTPQENIEGYQKSRVHNATAIGQSTRFLLMHGSGDDNVHIQNSMKFLDLLDLSSIENYDVHVFPDSDHSISFHNAGTMVYNRLFHWIKRAYRGDYVSLNF